MISDHIKKSIHNNQYQSARYYQKLATEKTDWKPVKNFTSYRSNPVEKYNGQDISMDCPVNDIYYSALPPGIEFKTHMKAPASVSRNLYPTLRIPDGQFLYPNMDRYEPMLNGKGLFYDTAFQDLNPVPDIEQVGYGRKLFPLTDKYMREISVYSSKTLPYPDF